MRAGRHDERTPAVGQDAGPGAAAGAEPGPDGFRVEPYRAPWWLRGAHAQTIAGRLLRRPRPPAFRRTRIDTPDGDFVDIDAAPPHEAERPLVLLLHGLEGSARRGYAINTYRALARHGLRGAGLNFRSCSGEPNRAARFYHSGDSDELRFVLDAVAHALGAPVRAAIGFSLGGNVLLKYLGEEGDAAARRLAGAVAVSVPFDLGAGARSMERSVMGRFYMGHFMKSLVSKAVAKRTLLEGRIDLARVAAARTFREFDDAATAPLHGFASADDYYARSSSGPLLPRIRVPTLLLHAMDDPFLPAAVLPVSAIEANPCLLAGITATGGHVGFLHGPPWALRFWAEEQAARYLARVLGPAGPRAGRGDHAAVDAPGGGR
jgi:predicted alpha/beta-fold hydrolase